MPSVSNSSDDDIQEVEQGRNTPELIEISYDSIEIISCNQPKRNETIIISDDSYKKIQWKVPYFVTLQNWMIRKNVVVLQLKIRQFLVV